MKLLRDLFAIGMLLVAMAGGGSPAQASQPDPPVRVEVTTQQVRGGRVVARVSATATLPVSNAVLLVEPGPGLAAPTRRIPLDLRPGRTQTLSIPLDVKTAGAFPVDFRVQARAPGFREAGGAARCYVLADGGNTPRLLKGVELRRELRASAEAQVKQARARDPRARIGVETFLAPELADRPATSRPIRAHQVQATRLASPPVAIPVYERDLVQPMQARSGNGPQVTIQGRLLYLDREGNPRPLVNAAVDIRDKNVGFSDMHLTTVVTDWSGRYRATVPNFDMGVGELGTGIDPYLRIRLANSRFQVQDGSGVPYSWLTSARTNVSSGVLDLGDRYLAGSNTRAAWVFMDLNQGWNHLTAVGGHDPGFVDCQWPADGSYTAYGDAIRIGDGDEVARDTVLHEYAHATMYLAYGNYIPPNSGGSHTLDTMSEPKFAFVEGWATFIPQAINPDGVRDGNGWSRDVENFAHSTTADSNSNGRSHVDCVSGSTATGDGRVNEGHVAAALVDLLDTTSEPKDSSGFADPSGANSVPFRTIWHAFWGSRANDLGEYWNALNDHLARQQVTAAAMSFRHNWVKLGVGVLASGNRLPRRELKGSSRDSRPKLARPEAAVPERTLQTPRMEMQTPRTETLSPQTHLRRPAGR